MVKKLQKRIAFTLTGILTLIMLGIQIVQFGTSYFYYVSYQKQLIEDIADGYIEVDDLEGTQIETEAANELAPVTEAEVTMTDWYLPVWVFTVEDENQLRLTQRNTGAENQADIKQEEITEKAEEILSFNKKSGIYEKIWYLHKGSILVLMDDRESLNYFGKQALTAGIGSCIGFLLIALCSLFISRWLIKPAAQAFEQQKQFISDASHELKTPLAVIGANAERLHGEIGGNKWLGYILEENKRMGRLLNELLTLAKVENEAGRNYETVDLSKIVNGALLPYESIAYEKGVEFWMDIQEDVVIQGEKEHLGQAVMILTENAFHHVSAHGEIKAKLVKKGKWAEISVSNTGPVIPKEEQQKIFQRFYRVEKARSRAENRYGLGLAIASGIAKRHKGRIEVHSDEGKTTFTLSLIAR